MIVAVRSGARAGVPVGGAGGAGLARLTALASARLTARRSQYGTILTFTGLRLPLSTSAVKSSSMRISCGSITALVSMTVDVEVEPSLPAVLVTRGTS